MQAVYDDRGLLVQIQAVWCIEDVYHRAQERGIELCVDEASDVLGLAYKHHDCNIGINWEVLDVWIDHVVNERK